MAQSLKSQEDQLLQTLVKNLVTYTLDLSNADYLEDGIQIILGFTVVELAAEEIRRWDSLPENVKKDLIMAEEKTVYTQVNKKNTQLLASIDLSYDFYTSRPLNIATG